MGIKVPDTNRAAGAAGARHARPATNPQQTTAIAQTSVHFPPALAGQRRMTGKLETDPRVTYVVPLNNHYICVDDGFFLLHDADVFPTGSAGKVVVSMFDEPSDCSGIGTAHKAELMKLTWFDRPESG
ncbi:hypothetical protein CJF34_21465 [Pseudomonas lundensis]|nr:hypothetical protein CJF36_22450 [Pseudomonas lundensis]OZY48659.1 hypothetical protein CJF34_21465 [Pseudomonas lundensis]